MFALGRTARAKKPEHLDSVALPYGESVTVERDELDEAESVWLVPSGPYKGKLFVNPQPRPLHADTADFRDAGDRTVLSTLGIHSTDRHKHKANRAKQRAIDLYIEGAYALVQGDRKKTHEDIATRLEAFHNDGIWARSTPEYSERCRAADATVVRLARVQGYGTAPDFEQGYAVELDAE